jgi:hypothetical protein
LGHFWLQEGHRSNQPIVFFGKVVDQAEHPVPGFEVEMETTRFDPDHSRLTMGIPLRRTTHEVVTDADGRFLLEGEQGDSLRIVRIEKSGYRQVRRYLPSFNYGREGALHRPDPDDPVVFQVWKEEGAVPLLRHERMTRISYDGTPLYLNLENGRLGAAGDVRLRLLRDPRELTGLRDRFDWILRVEVPDGGLVEASSDAGWAAPADGYESAFDFVALGEDPEWTPVKEFHLFVRARGGRYFGRVTLRLDANSNQPATGLTYTAIVNPNGSRNLEYDWSLQINPD